MLIEATKTVLKFETRSVKMLIVDRRFGSQEHLKYARAKYIELPPKMVTQIPEEQYDEGLPTEQMGTPAAGIYKRCTVRKLVTRTNRIVDRLHATT